MIALLILVGVVLVLAAGFWYGLRGKPNQGPELGNNWPYPTSVLPFAGSSPEIMEEDERADGGLQT